MERAEATVTHTPSVESVRVRLEEQWRDRVDEISRLSVELYSPHDSAGDHSALSSHAVEQGLVEAQLDRARRAAADLEAALRRVDDGRYGVCERCRRAIDPARLAALPHTTRCASCPPAAPPG